MNYPWQNYVLIDERFSDGKKCLLSRNSSGAKFRAWKTFFVDLWECKIEVCLKWAPHFASCTFSISGCFWRVASFLRFLLTKNDFKLTNIYWSQKQNLLAVTLFQLVGAIYVFQVDFKQRFEDASHTFEINQCKHRFIWFPMRQWLVFCADPCTTDIK